MSETAGNRGRKEEGAEGEVERGVRRGCSARLTLAMDAKTQIRRMHGGY